MTVNKLLFLVELDNYKYISNKIIHFVDLTAYGC